MNPPKKSSNRRKFSERNDSFGNSGTTGKLGGTFDTGQMHDASVVFLSAPSFFHEIVTLINWNITVQNLRLACEFISNQRRNERAALQCLLKDMAYFKQFLLYSFQQVKYEELQEHTSKRDEKKGKTRKRRRHISSSFWRMRQHFWRVRTTQLETM